MTHDSPFIPPNSRYGVLMYDGSCGACTATVGKNKRFFERHGFAVVSIQTPGLAEWVGLDEYLLMEEIYLKTPDGRIVRGIESLILVSQHVWWLKPLGWLASLPLFRSLFHWGYRIFARYRQKISGLCGLR